MWCKHSAALEFNKIRQMSKSLKKKNNKANLANRKNQNQINIFKNISVKVALK